MASLEGTPSVPEMAKKIPGSKNLIPGLRGAHNKPTQYSTTATKENQDILVRANPSLNSTTLELKETL